LSLSKGSATCEKCDGHAAAKRAATKTLYLGCFSRKWTDGSKRIRVAGAAIPEKQLTTERGDAILNHMVKYSETALNRTFAALSDPTRRAMLAMLRGRSRSVSELARPFPISLPAAMKHLDVLAGAGLIERKKAGRTVACTLSAAPMMRATRWLRHYERFWEESMDRLADYLNAIQRGDTHEGGR
jgi:DNA-binding transcriptional ArsR family regulator